MVNASIFQMMKGSIVAMCALLSRVFLRRMQKSHQVIGIVLIMGGIIIAGYSQNDSSFQQESNQTLGIILIISS